MLQLPYETLLRLAAKAKYTPAIHAIIFQVFSWQVLRWFGRISSQRAMNTLDQSEKVEVDQEPLFQLPKSGLAVEAGILIKRNSKGAVIARHALRTIEEIELGRRLDSLTLVIALGLLGLASLCWYAIPFELWSWLLSIAFLVWALLSFASMHPWFLAITTSEGRAAYDLLDDDDEIQGFVLSLQEVHGQARANESAQEPARPHRK